MATENPSNPAESVLPDAASNVPKKAQVAEMFDHIAKRYDFLNNLLSLGIDSGWRSKAIKVLAPLKPKMILDVATGTGDLALQAVILRPKQIIGVDISEGMLAVGKKKARVQKLDHIVSLQFGDSDALPFFDDHFDAVMCAFGVRNFENLQNGLEEMRRVLKPGGKVVILEFSNPKHPKIKSIYDWYFSTVVPKIGAFFSRHKTAYQYLPESVRAFPEGTQFCERLINAGFKNPVARPLTFGIATLYSADL